MPCGSLPTATHLADPGLCVLALSKQVREAPRTDVCAKGWPSSAETYSAARAGRVVGNRLTLIVLTVGW